MANHIRERGQAEDKEGGLVLGHVDEIGNVGCHGDAGGSQNVGYGGNILALWFMVLKEGVCSRLMN